MYKTQYTTHGDYFQQLLFQNRLSAIFNKCPQPTLHRVQIDRTPKWMFDVIDYPGCAATNLPDIARRRDWSASVAVPCYTLSRAVIRG